MKIPFTLALAFCACAVFIISAANSQIGPGFFQFYLGPGPNGGGGGGSGPTPPTPPSQPALLPAEPISPTPAIDLNFTTASYSGCTVAACLPITRTANETCYSLSSSPAVTYAGANMPCITDYGFGSTYQASANIFLWSEQLTNAVWTTQNATIALAGIGPDGTNSTYLLTDNSVNAQHRIRQVIAVTAGHTYVMSGVGHSALTKYVQLNYNNSGGVLGNLFADFDLDACAVTATGAIGSALNPTPNLASAGTQALNGGYCRIWLIDTATSSASVTANAFLIPYATAAGALSYFGTGVYSVDLTEMQVEDGVLTPYIMTTTAPASRDADVVSASGALLSLLSGSQGYVVGDTGSSSVASGVVISRNRTTDVFAKIVDLMSVGAVVSGASQAMATIGSLPYLYVGPTNIGSSWNSAGISAVVNGGAVVDSATPYGATINSFVGSADGTQGFLNAHIRRIFGGATKSIDSVLQALAPLQGAPIPPPIVAYFSGGGSDSNPCTMAQPCQTIAQLNSLSYPFGSSIFLDAATPFTGCISLTPTNVPLGNAQLPIVIGAYNGSQWSLTTNCTGDAQADAGSVAAVQINSVSGVTIQDCLIRQGVSGTPLAGVWFTNFGSSQIRGLTVQRCDIGGFLRKAGPPGGAFADVAVTSNSSGPGINGVNVLNNTLHGLTGVTATASNGIGGFGNGANIFNVNYSGNLVFDHGGIAGDINGGSGNGIPLGGLNGGIVQFNLVHDNGANTTTCGGPVGIESANSTGFVVRFNEVYNEQPVPFVTGCDWTAMDPDIGSQLTQWEYNYTHKNFGAGMENYMSNSTLTWHDVTFRFNISEDDFNHVPGLIGASVGFTNELANSNVYFYNNTVWQDLNRINEIIGFCCFFNSSSPNTGWIANNIFVHNNAGLNILVFNQNVGAFPPNLKWVNNDWYLPTGGATPSWNDGTTNYTTLATWQTAYGDVGATAANPSLTSGGSGGTLTWAPSTIASWPPIGAQPSAYVLQVGSAMKSAGIDLTGSPYSLNVGSRDYYANAIPGSGPCWNRGADGSCP